VPSQLDEESPLKDIIYIFIRGFWRSDLYEKVIRTKFVTVFDFDCVSIPINVYPLRHISLQNDACIKLYLAPLADKSHYPIGLSQTAF
jgi:hypothetical protein